MQTQHITHVTNTHNNGRLPVSGTDKLSFISILSIAGIMSAEREGLELAIHTKYCQQAAESERGPGRCKTFLIRKVLAAHAGTLISANTKLDTPSHYTLLVFETCIDH